MQGVSTIANIIQVTKETLGKLDADNLEIPKDPAELTNDIQAVISRVIQGGK